MMHLRPVVPSLNHCLLDGLDQGEIAYLGREGLTDFRILNRSGIKISRVKISLQCFNAFLLLVALLQLPVLDGEVRHNLPRGRQQVRAEVEHLEPLPQRVDGHGKRA